jgi:hypothetical protein
MEQDEARLRRAPVERFAGPEHVYNLAEIAEKLRTEPHPATNGHRQITIAHHGSVALVLFDFEALDAGAGFESGMASALVLTGATTRDDVARSPFAPRFVLDGVGGIVPPGMAAAGEVQR